MTTSDHPAINRRAAIEKILELARWAPSGDNTQPWKFQVQDADHIIVLGFDTRDWCVYDFDGRASQMAHGALLETLRIAATGFGLLANWTTRAGCPDTAPIYDVTLHAQADLARDPLFPFIEQRVVQRRPMRTTPLTKAQRASFVAAAGPAFEVRFFETFSDRLRVARLLWDNAYIRLTCPEAFEVHRRTIEWGVRYSTDRIPEQAIGVDPLTAKLMRRVMVSWPRVQFFNRYLGGTLLPRVQLDLLPALRCSAHLLLKPRQRPIGIAGYVRAGTALQRVWLTATSLGMHLQPEVTPIIFRWYARANRSMSALPGIDRRAHELADVFDALAGAALEDDFTFLCRVGRSKTPWSRSSRRDLDILMKAPH